MEAAQRHRVLVVDDHLDIVNAMCTLLDALGHDTHALTRGGEVLATVESFRPTLVILDIGLPDVSGYELARMLRARGHTGRLVALSGWGAPADRQRALEAGFDEFLVKPIDADIVQEVLARVG